jgi:phosphodiesterase/alkaline phosphatase D-like protein
MMKLLKTVSGMGLLAAAIQFSLAGDYGNHAAAHTVSSLPNGIASGDTTQTSTVLWARSTLAGRVRFQVKNGHGVLADNAVDVENPKIPAKLVVSHLRPDTRYRYRVTAPDGQFLDGSFKTAADSKGERGLSFGVTGDWRGELAPYPAINNALNQPLDFFVKLGDTIYADIASPAVPQGQARTLAEYRAKHEEVYASHAGINTFAALQRNVSQFATIDDHEVTNDFAGGAQAGADPRFPENSGYINQSVLYKNGLRAFSEYNPIRGKRYPVIGDACTDGRPDLYRSQRYGKTAAVYILDARSFRDQELPGVVSITDPSEIGSFIARSFDAGNKNTRTMLGGRQLARLMQDLRGAQREGVIWKFVMLPEPIQNLGVLGAGDRYEGYASERSQLLRFIDEEQIKNVVFVAADIHGTLINDLSYHRREEVLAALATYGNPLAAPQHPTSAFEITTGSVAFAPAFGDAVTGLLGSIPGGNLLLQEMLAAVRVNTLDEFRQLPMAVKNAALQALINKQLEALGYSPIGLQDNSLIKAKLTKGGSSALFSFGWSRFDIEAKTHELKITTYGIEPYTAEELVADSASIIKRQPKVLSQLHVKPQY